jgi:hypothetical protein
MPNAARECNSRREVRLGRMNGRKPRDIRPIGRNRPKPRARRRRCADLSAGTDGQRRPRWAVPSPVLCRLAPRTWPPASSRTLEPIAISRQTAIWCRERLNRHPDRARTGPFQRHLTRIP